MSESDPVSEKYFPTKPDGPEETSEPASQNGDAYLLKEKVTDPAKQDSDESKFDAIKSSNGATCPEGDDVKDEGNGNKQEGENQNKTEAASNEKEVNRDGSTEEKKINREITEGTEVKTVEMNDTKRIIIGESDDAKAVDGEDVEMKVVEGDVMLVKCEAMTADNGGQEADGDKTVAETQQMIAKDMHLDEEKANEAEEIEQVKQVNDPTEECGEATDQMVEHASVNQNEYVEKQGDNKEEMEEAKEHDDNEGNKQDINGAEDEDVKDEENKEGDGEDNKECMEEVNENEEATRESDEVADRKDQNEKTKDAEVKIEGDNKLGETPKYKRARSVSDKNQGKDKKHELSNSGKIKELNTPSPYALDRPIRERKSVERLVEVIEKEPNRTVVIQKGRGTPLRDIPNVAHKLARKKPADLKLIHQTLFGRIGKAIDYKRHLLRYSGFVWHESDEKQRAKMKEKLDKFAKDTLLDMCHLFDISVSRTNSKKEDLITQLLDFIAEPHANADAVVSEEEASKSGKRKRVNKGSSTNGSEGAPIKRHKTNFEDGEAPSKAQGGHSYDTDDEDEADESEERSEDEDVANEYQYDVGRERGSGKGPSNKSSSAGKERALAVSRSKVHSVGKCTTKASPKQSEDVESPEAGEKVFSRNRSNGTPKQDASSGSSGRKVTKTKGKAGDSLPSNEDLKKTITGILKKVDFNTATFSDILKKLASHYKMDMTPRKEAVKILIQEELARIAEEAGDDDEENEYEDVKDSAPKSKGQRLVS